MAENKPSIWDWRDTQPGNALDEDSKPSIWDWYDTTADHNWKDKLNALSDTSVPSPVSSDDWNRMTEQEKDIYRSLLDQTRTKQNGPYPGNCL